VPPRQLGEQDQQLDVGLFVAFLSAPHEHGGVAFLLGTH
jgi:hypothetical protein